MKKMLFLSLLLLGASASSLSAEDMPARSEAPQGAVARGDNEKAIRALLDMFTRAFNAGDAASAAATYTENAIVVDEKGKQIEGIAAIRDLYKESFAGNAGSKLALEVDSLRFIGPETAIEEGRATITPAESAEAPEISHFTAVYVKQAGRWLQAAVRDEPSQELGPHERLKELGWMLGDWVNESDDATVSTTCKWSKDGNFIDREFTMKTKGQPVLSGNQRIGWDPLKRQFKTWIFDSEGGHGEGYFTHLGNQWRIKVEGVGREGKPISATNIITRLGKDRLGWQSVDRTVGGEAIDGVDEFVVVRPPPEIAK